MKQLLGVALLALLSMSTTRAEETAVMTGSGPTLLQQDVEKVAPALQAYAKNRLLNDVWKRPGLAPRDRSIVTLAALIARNQTIELAHHVDLALDNGLPDLQKPEVALNPSLKFLQGRERHGINRVRPNKPCCRTFVDPKPAAADRDFMRNWRGSRS